MDDFFEENAPEQIKKRYKTPAAKKKLDPEGASSCQRVRVSVRSFSLCHSVQVCCKSCFAASRLGEEAVDPDGLTVAVWLFVGVTPLAIG